jgi:hypothetical protein
MKHLRTLSVTFAEPIRWEELECFRGAMAEKVGIQHDFYHNHNNEPGAKLAFHYRYPLIQYQLRRGRPRLLFLDEAIEEARYFFGQPDWSLQLNGRPYQSAIEALKADQYAVDVTPGEFHRYRLRHWQALNAENYAAFQAARPLRDKVALLERVLASQILAFATGIGYRLPHRLELYLTDWHHTRPARYKGVKVFTFEVSFEANMLLPAGIGLGKGVSVGYGGCWGDYEQRNDEQRNVQMLNEEGVGGGTFKKDRET